MHIHNNRAPFLSNEREAHSNTRSGLTYRGLVPDRKSGTSRLTLDARRMQFGVWCLQCHASRFDSNFHLKDMPNNLEVFFESLWHKLLRDDPRYGCY
jgi:hypothetical protein